MVEERTYTVPLRRGFWKTPRYKRTNKAVKTLREFLSKHMKTVPKDVKLGQHLNHFLWENGIRNPPAKVQVDVKKDSEGIVRAELHGMKYSAIEAPKERQEAPQGLKEKVQAMVGGKEDDKPEESEEAPEPKEKAESPKSEEKKA